MYSMDRHIKNYLETGFTVIAFPKQHYVDFEIYEIVGWDDGDDSVYWQRKGAKCNPDPVEKIEDAEMYAHGYIKWDGCSNWHFDEQDRVMLHFCTQEQLTNLGKILAECWDWMEELCPAWNP